MRAMNIVRNAAPSKTIHNFWKRITVVLPDAIAIKMLEQTVAAGDTALHDRLQELFARVQGC